MPIRVMPFETIDAATIESLAQMRVREDHTLDFKRDLNLSARDDQAEFLKDVTSFANGSGGTLLYGVQEGEGGDEGIIVGYPGLALDQPDATHRLVDDMLRQSVDERILGVLHRAVPRDDGRYYYLVRIPGSPLAPHFVMLGKHRHKCFLRANTTTDTMGARQMKETALRTETALDRASALVANRRAALIERAAHAPEDGGLVDHPTDDSSQMILHVVPLFPVPGGFVISDDRIVDRLSRVVPFQWSSGLPDRRFTLDGLYLRHASNAQARFLRSGRRGVPAAENHRCEVWWHQQ